ncbi:hypothetical protein [Winogradskyella rapida]|uniref:Uncharacterized protein n=1 Tax=Winogradskyella rapida TaxID=549701 RepID=A0ABW3KML4_9FLAO
MNNISELKEEKKKLLRNLKIKSIAIKKSFFFANHYSYLDQSGKQILLLVSTFIIGIMLSALLGFTGFFVPYFAWVGYDIYRMEDLVSKYNAPINQKLTEVNNLIDEHMKVKSAIENTVVFLGKFNKKAS